MNANGVFIFDTKLGGQLMAACGAPSLPRGLIKQINFNGQHFAPTDTAILINDPLAYDFIP
jgi:hypothetical protein